MNIEKEIFETWMKRIMDRFDITDAKIEKAANAKTRIDGKVLLDNQDLCIMLTFSIMHLATLPSFGNVEVQAYQTKDLLFRRSGT